jgi:hypothetical protein
VGQARCRILPVVGEGVVKPVGAEDASVGIVWEIVIVQASDARRKVGEWRETVTEKPLCFGKG